MEKISIRNFWWIENESFEISKFNVFIWSQASWKSIVSKLLFYFKSYPEFLSDTLEEIEDLKDDSINRKIFIDNLIDKFESYFQIDWMSWNQDFYIAYKCGKIEISVSKNWKWKRIKIEESKNIKSLFNKYKKTLLNRKEKESKDKFSQQNIIKIRSWIFKEFNESNGWLQFYIPAWRGYFANFQTWIYSILEWNKAIDPFFPQFWRFYQNMKRFYDNRDPKEIKYLDDTLNQIIKWKYKREKSTDFIIHEDWRKVNLVYASSWQQESLPLLICLTPLQFLKFPTNNITLYIEEPEAHLFPESQKYIIEYIVKTLNIAKENKNNLEIQFIINTHSPYLLSIINNLILSWEHKKSGIRNLSHHLFLDSENTRAYFLCWWKKKDILENWEISLSEIDNVSNEIFNDTERLIEFEN